MNRRFYLLLTKNMIRNASMNTDIILCASTKLLHPLVKSFDRFLIKKRKNEREICLWQSNFLISPASPILVTQRLK